MIGIRIAFCNKCQVLRELDNWVKYMHGSVNHCHECGSSDLNKASISKYIYIKLNQGDKRSYLLDQMLHGNYKREFDDNG